MELVKEDFSDPKSYVDLSEQYELILYKLYMGYISVDKAIKLVSELVKD